MPHVLIARNVSKSYGQGAGRVMVLQDVSLQTKAGELLFLVGPSGCGKTTLLSILGCLLAPDQGELSVLGRDVKKLDTRQLTEFRRQNMGFVFQTFNLFSTLSARDNIVFSLVLQRVEKRHALRRADEVLELVDLQDRRHLRPSQLSHGECQRVAIARALAGQGRLLFADEPTASLDKANGQRVIELLTSLARTHGTTLVVVTHDVRLYSYADRILHLEDGHLHECSSETDLTEAEVDEKAELSARNNNDSRSRR